MHSPYRRTRGRRDDPSTRAGRQQRRPTGSPVGIGPVDSPPLALRWSIVMQWKSFLNSAIALMTAVGQLLTREFPQVLAVIRLLVLTGARVSELLGLRWDHLRRDEMELHLVWTKSGFSRRPMSAAALAVIDSMERVPGVPFIFRSVKAPNARISYNTVQKAFGRIVERAKIEGCTLHTIRHWFSTLAANSVSNARVGMALTGHKSHAAYMNYVHADKDQAQALIEHISQHSQPAIQDQVNISPQPLVCHLFEF